MAIWRLTHSSIQCCWYSDGHAAHVSANLRCHLSASVPAGAFPAKALDAPAGQKQQRGSIGSGIVSHILQSICITPDNLQCMGIRLQKRLHEAVLLLLHDCLVVQPREPVNKRLNRQLLPIASMNAIASTFMVTKQLVVPAVSQHKRIWC